MIGIANESQRLRLLRRTRKSPLLYGTPRVTTSADRLVFHSGRSRVPAMLAGIAFGGLFVAAGIWAWEELRAITGPDPAPGAARIVVGALTAGAVFSWLVGMALVAAGIYALLQRGEIACDPLRREMRIRYGALWRLHEVNLPAQQLSVRLYVSKDQRALNYTTYKRGHVILALCPAGSNEIEVRIAAASKRLAMLPAFGALSDFLEGRARDSTLTEVELQDGRRVLASAVSVSPFSADFATTRLRFPTPDTAILSRSAAALTFWTIILVGGCFVLSFPGYISLQEGSVIGLLLAGVVGGLFVTFGAIGLYPGFGIRHVAFDRLRGTISVAPGLGVRSVTERSWSFADVAAVQLCSKYVEGGDAPGYTTYELNLILTRPESERLTLTSHAGESRVRDDARRLAEFLGKPLLDHT